MTYYKVLTHFLSTHKSKLIVEIVQNKINILFILVEFFFYKAIPLVENISSSLKHHIQ